MHSEGDLPDFLRDGWYTAEERKPEGQRTVNVRLEDGKVTTAMYARFDQQDGTTTGEWIEEIVGRRLRALPSVRAWRSLVAVTYSFDWSSLELLKAPRAVHYRDAGASLVLDIAFVSGESVTITTGHGEAVAREEARRVIEHERAKR